MLLGQHPEQEAAAAAAPLPPAKRQRFATGGTGEALCGQLLPALWPALLCFVEIVPALLAVPQLK